MAEREGFLLAPTRSRGATHRKLAHSLPTHALLIPPSKKTKKTPLGVFFVFAVRFCALRELFSSKAPTKEAEAVPAAVPKPRDSPSEKPFFAFRICARPSFFFSLGKESFSDGGCSLEQCGGERLLIPV